MMFQCDQLNEMRLFQGKYSSSLSSADLFDPELPLYQRAKGGCMILWKTHLDSYIYSCSSPSSSFLPIVFSPPGSRISIHFAIYLPTAGKDSEFVEEMVKLGNCIEELLDKHPDATIFIRGDANVNPNNTVRCKILKRFCEQWNLVSSTILHPTYHHFTGNGASDSLLDILLHSETATEDLTQIICKLTNPLVTSHHDALVSSFSLPHLIKTGLKPELPLAPKVTNNRVKVLWDKPGIDAYENCVGNNLARFRSTWLDPTSAPSISVLLQATNSFLDKCAKETNPTLSLSAPALPRSAKKPSYLVRSERILRQSYRRLKCISISASNYASAFSDHKAKKRQHHRLLRYAQVQERFTRDRSLNTLCSRDPGSAFNALRIARKATKKAVGKLVVGNKTYLGVHVADGMFESIKNLKTESDSTSSDTCHLDFSEEYKLIIDICKSGKRIPPISKEKSNGILKSIRKNVNDIYSITAQHYLNAGKGGLDHFCFLLNSIIANINLAGLPELNTIYACILYKCHGKDRTSDRSYRTISTCPLVAKGLDLYVRELCLDDWNGCQAPTQFQGTGMSHELAALLLTETLQHSLNVAKLPVFALFLDAKSAFDRVLKNILVRNMFLAGTTDQRLLYLDQRLGNRETYCEFDKQLMGPIKDIRGLEQGGVSSSDQYKLYNNEQASLAQFSELGVTFRSQTISCISLADDASLLSNNIHNLRHLLFLTSQYCKKYQVELVPDKTKLLVFAKNSDVEKVVYPKAISSLSLNSEEIIFSEEAEHLGIIRSSSCSNMANIMSRLSSYKKQLHSLLPAGLALHHHANPAACLRVERLYAMPVLLSGLAALVLTKAELKAVYDCHKNTLSRLMKLHDKTPDCVVFLLAGSLPATALLHLRQLSLFHMICHLEGNILQVLAKEILVEARTSSKSWFLELRNLCVQYELPHPLHLLENPYPKKIFKKLCKEKVTEFWHKKFSLKAGLLPSLQYLKPQFLTLSSPHPLWTSLDNNPYQAKAARIQAILLSGKYRSERLCRYWSHNKEGFCLLQPCKNLRVYEDIEHIFIQCGGLTSERRRLETFTKDFLSDKPVLQPIVNTYLLKTTDSYLRMQFFLDCSVLPLVISTFQTYGVIIHQQLFRISRTWCRSLHVARLKALGRYNKL